MTCASVLLLPPLRACNKLFKSKKSSFVYALWKQLVCCEQRAAQNRRLLWYSRFRPACHIIGIFSVDSQRVIQLRVKRSNQFLPSKWCLVRDFECNFRLVHFLQKIDANMLSTWASLQNGIVAWASVSYWSFPACGGRDVCCERPCLEKKPSWGQHFSKFRGCELQSITIGTWIRWTFRERKSLHGTKKKACHKNCDTMWLSSISRCFVLTKHLNRAQRPHSLDRLEPLPVSPAKKSAAIPCLEPWKCSKILSCYFDIIISYIYIAICIYIYVESLCYC